VTLKHWSENSWLNTNQVGLKPVIVNKQCDFTESSYIMHPGFFLFFIFYTVVFVQFKTTKYLNVFIVGWLQISENKSQFEYDWVCHLISTFQNWRDRHVWDSEMPTKMISGLEIRAPEEEFKELLSFSLRKDGNSHM